MMALILAKSPSLFHRDEVTHVVRYPLDFLVMGRGGLEQCGAYVDSEL
jgi:hypothetical protein